LEHGLDFGSKGGNRPWETSIWGHTFGHSSVGFFQLFFMTAMGAAREYMAVHIIGSEELQTELWELGKKIILYAFLVSKSNSCCARLSWFYRQFFLMFVFFLTGPWDSREYKWAVKLIGKRKELQTDFLGLGKK